MQIPDAGQPEDLPLAECTTMELEISTDALRMLQRDPGGPESQILNRPSAKSAELDFRASFKDHARCYRMSVQLTLTIH